VAGAFPVGTILDGEVYIPGVPLQTLNSLIKRHQDESLALSYHIYDMPCIDGGFERRYEELSALMNSQVAKAAPCLKLVETLQTTSEADTLQLERQFVAAGYEGLMIRLRGHEYEWDARSYNLLKVKTFQDAEFMITEVPGREYFIPGSSKSMMIVDKFVLRNNTSDDTFESVPVGTMQQRAEWYRIRESLIGAMATVRFYGRSKDGIPSYNPVVKAVRLGEDLPLQSDGGLWG
jgi:ATP-dependent DNA ligase